MELNVQDPFLFFLEIYLLQQYSLRRRRREGEGGTVSTFIGLVKVFYLEAHLRPRPKANQTIPSEASKSVLAKTMVWHHKAIVRIETISQHNQTYLLAFASGSRQPNVPLLLGHAAQIKQGRRLSFLPSNGAQSVPVHRPTGISLHPTSIAATTLTTTTVAAPTNHDVEGSVLLDGFLGDFYSFHLEVVKPVPRFALFINQF